MSRLISGDLLDGLDFNSTDRDSRLVMPTSYGLSAIIWRGGRGSGRKPQVAVLVTYCSVRRNINRSRSHRTSLSAFLPMGLNSTSFFERDEQNTPRRFMRSHRTALPIGKQRPEVGHLDQSERPHEPARGRCTVSRATLLKAITFSLRFGSARCYCRGSVRSGRHFRRSCAVRSARRA